MELKELVESAVKAGIAGKKFKDLSLIKTTVGSLSDGRRLYARAWKKESHVKGPGKVTILKKLKK